MFRATVRQICILTALAAGKRGKAGQIPRPQGIWDSVKPPLQGIEQLRSAKLNTGRI